MKRKILLVILMGMFVFAIGCGIKPRETGTIFCSFSYGGAGFGTKLDCLGSEVFIYTNGRVEMMVDGKRAATTTIKDMDELTKKIDIDFLLSHEVESDYDVCDGTSSGICIYDKNGEVEKEIGGYMVKDEWYQEYRNALISAVGEEWLEESLEDYKESLPEDYFD